MGRHPDRTLPAPDERICLAQCPVFVPQGKDYIVFAYGKELRLEYCNGPVEASRPEGIAVERELDLLDARSRTSREGPANNQMEQTKREKSCR